MVTHHATNPHSLYNDDIEEADDDDVGNEDEDDEYNEITEAPPVLTANNLPIVPIKNLMPDPPNLSGSFALFNRASQHCRYQQKFDGFVPVSKFKI